MDNYRFCAEFAARHGGRVLDYGCGKGQIVEKLLAKGIDAYGCDVFYEGGDYRDRVDKRLTAAGRIVEMRERIPFPDEHFDVVVNNQVMEHVADLDAVLLEIHRVTKAGGVLLSLFPDDSIWREGHTEVPFLHWFPKGNLRVYYALAFRVVGLGASHGDTPMITWAQKSCEWIDKWCYYRPYAEIMASVQRLFSPPEHIEVYWMDTRLGARARLLPEALKRFIARKWGGMVFTCQKASA